MKTCTFNPMTHKVVPIEITEDMKMASDINSVYSAEEQYKFILDVAPEYPADAGWISVDERLPDDCNGYLCYAVRTSGSKFMTTSGLNPAKTAFYVEYDGCEPSEIVTHWMPLPPAPEVA
jgi:hypothetical protein